MADDKKKATALSKPRASVRRRSFEGGDLRNVHDKAKLFGNMVSSHVDDQCNQSR